MQCWQLSICESDVEYNMSFNFNFGHGGEAINSHDHSSRVTIRNSTLTGNFTVDGGGAIWVDDSEKYESRNCTFKDNNPNDASL